MITFYKTIEENKLLSNSWNWVLLVYIGLIKSKHIFNLSNNIGVVEKQESFNYFTFIILDDIIVLLEDIK